MHTRIVSALIIAVSALAGTFVLSCGRNAGKKVAERAIERASGGKAKVDLGSSGNIDLSGLPDNLRYPGAKAVARVAATDEETKGTSFVLKTSDPANSVIAFYKQALAGWTQSMTAETEEGTIIAASSPDKKQNIVVTVGFDRDEKQTTISLVLSTK